MLFLKETVLMQQKVKTSTENRSLLKSWGSVLSPTTKSRYNQPKLGLAGLQPGFRWLNWWSMLFKRGFGNQQL